jgi:hypothetical protein
VESRIAVPTSGRHFDTDIRIGIGIDIDIDIDRGSAVFTERETVATSVGR